MILSSLGDCHRYSNSIRGEINSSMTGAETKTELDGCFIFEMFKV